MALTKVSNSLQNSAAVSVIDYGADPLGVADSTSAFTSALAVSKLVLVPNGKYRINGTITLPTGCVLYGNMISGEYYTTLAPDMGPKLFKDASSTNGPIITMGQSTGLRGIYLSHLKTNGATTGVVRFPSDVTVNYACIQDCHIFAERTADIGGTTTSYGIKMEGHATTATTCYYNRISNVHITDCDVGIYMSDLCNANVFTTIQTRECHVHYELKGQTVSAYDVIENTFTSLGLFSILSTLSPDPVGFKISNASGNNFIGYATEMYGREFDPSTEVNMSNNYFLGTANEDASWTNAHNLRYDEGIKVNNFDHFYVTSRTTNDRQITGTGAATRQLFFVGGTLPQQNNNTGTLTASDADNKVIFRFPENFTKANKPSFFAKLRVFAYGPEGNGMGMVEVHFGYSVRNETSSAGSFEVFEVNQIGDEITGLYFLTGVAAVDEMGVALVGGNYGALSFVNIRCDLEYTVFDFGSDSAFFSKYTDLTSTTTADVTANDVTDGISLLTVATTSV